MPQQSGLEGQCDQGLAAWEIVRRVPELLDAPAWKALSRMPAYLCKTYHRLCPELLPPCGGKGHLTFAGV